MESKTFVKEKLGNLVEYILDYRGKTPRKSEHGIPTLSAKTVKNNYIDYNEAYFISEDEYNRFMTKGLPSVGDILLTMEAPLGLVATLDRDDVGLGQRIVTIKGKDSVLDNNYLKFYLQSPVGQYELQSRATGTTVIGISQKNLKNIDLILPPYNIQVLVGQILDNYNKKIEINNKIIENLEEQAQAIFKSWFVDFEPFQDGNFVESELGLIPEGWEVVKFGDLFKFQKGKKPKSFLDYGKEEGVPYIVKGVIDGSESPSYTLDEKIIKIENMDIFMLMDGANAGNIYYGYNGALGSTFSFLNIEDLEYREFIYWFLKSNENYIRNQNTGSAIPHANKDFINNIRFALPKNISKINILNYFKVIRTKVITLKLENQTLAQTRDTLLPKLMSGEIDVSNIKIDDEDTDYE